MDSEHGLESSTSDIRIVRLSIPEIAFGDLVFLDTPGFNDTTFYTGTGKISVDILIMLADWLKSTYVLVNLLTSLLRCFFLQI